MFGPRCDFRAHLAHASRQQFVRDDRAVRGIGYDDMQFGIRLVSADFRANKQSAVGGALQRKRLHVRFRHDLHPHALPNAALRGVPNPLALDFLLAAHLRTRIVRIVHAQRNLESIIGIDECRNIDVKRQISPDMHPCKLPVDKAGAHVIDRFEMQHQAVRIADLPNRFPSPKRHGMHHRAIPDHIVWVNRLMHAGKRGFRGERHQNLAVERFGDGRFLHCLHRFVTGEHSRGFAPFRAVAAFGNGYDRVIPESVEHGVIAAHHGWARMLVQDWRAAVFQFAFAVFCRAERLVGVVGRQPFAGDLFAPRRPQLLQRLLGTHFRRRGFQHSLDVQHKSLPAASHFPQLPHCNERNGKEK